MSAIDTIEKILNCQLVNADLRYCLVDSDKHPFKVDNSMAKPNAVDDFVSFENLLQNKSLNSYSGVGISIQASKICAVDVDHCFAEKNNESSISDIGRQVLDMFKDVAYCEFSFSGTGLRILFKAPIIANYTDKFYIKNKTNGIEYYQPEKSFRYVTVTGNTLHNNPVQNIDVKILFAFLETFMKRPEQTVRQTVKVEAVSDEVCMSRIKYYWFTDAIFQDLWFKKAPGSGHDESERDYHLVAFLYENVTQDHDQLKRMFEQSEFFKTKDQKHVYKWEQQNGRYFEYLFTQVQKRH